MSAASPLMRARQLYAERRSRDDALGPYATLMGEPAWDILLDLLIAHYEERPVQVLGLSGARLAPDAGVRWLALLQELGLVERLAQPDPGAARLVQLTAAGVALMKNALVIR